MLGDFPVHSTIPAHDMERAKRFYAEKLGFSPISESPGGLTYSSGDVTFILYPSQGAGTAQHTVMGWFVPNIEQVVAGLKSNGVKFEEYDMPGLKTVNSVAAARSTKAAWFKDSEGNILGIVELLD